MHTMHYILLPSSRWWWRRQRQISGPTAPTSSSPWWGWRWSTTRAHVIIIPSGWRHGTTSTARRHPIESSSTSHWEPTHRPSPSFFIHHSEATIVICLIIKVWVIGLGSTFNGSLRIMQDKYEFYLQTKKKH